MEYPRHRCRIAQDRRQLVHAQVHLLRVDRILQVHAHMDEHGVEADRLKRVSLVTQARELQEIADQPLHP